MRVAVGEDAGRAVVELGDPRDARVEHRLDGKIQAAVPREEGTNSEGHDGSIHDRTPGRFGSGVTGGR